MIVISESFPNNFNTWMSCEYFDFPFYFPLSHLLGGGNGDNCTSTIKNGEKILSPRHRV